MDTASSTVARRHLLSHGRVQMRPHTEGRVLLQIRS